MNSLIVTARPSEPVRTTQSLGKMGSASLTLGVSTEIPCMGMTRDGSKPLTTRCNRSRDLQPEPGKRVHAFHPSPLQVAQEISEEPCANLRGLFCESPSRMGLNECGEMQRLESANRKKGALGGVLVAAVDDLQGLAQCHLVLYP